MAEEATTNNKDTAAEEAADNKNEAKAEIPKKFAKLVKEIETLSVLDLSELVKVLEDHFGVSAAAPMAVAAAPAAGGDEDAAEEQSEFTLSLKDTGASKINVIKAVREITGQGLAESKGIVDGAPGVVKENLKKEEAEAAKKKLEEAGATAELS